MDANNLPIDTRALVEDNFFDLAGLQNLPEEQKQQILEKILSAVRSRVLVRIDDLLADDGRKKLEQLLTDQAGEEVIQQFLQEQQINVPQLVAEEALLFKSQLLRTIAALK